MYNLIKYTNNYSKRSGSLWQYYGDDPNDNITWYQSFKYKTKITGKTPAAGNTKHVKIAIPLKYLSNFWRTLEIRLINCEINLILTWSEDLKFKTKFQIRDTKLYVLVVTLSTQDNEKISKHLKSGFKRIISWNKYQTRVSAEGVNQSLDFLIDSSFQEVNRLFALSFENEGDRKVHTRYYLQKVEIKDMIDENNVMIDEKNFFNQPIKNKVKTYDNIRKNSASQGHYYTATCLLDYNHFKEH